MNRNLTPEGLTDGNVVLRLEKMVPADIARGYVPYYHFRILLADGSDVGHINFRVGDTEHVRFFAGHIGYYVAEPFRGNGYALAACNAIAPFLRSIYDTAIVTCDSDNYASMRIIERLGATFIDEVAVPPHDPHYNGVSRTKRRYAWRP